jgi:putative Ca2+/H+ antiporter (TMEM165/GDT1 family)
VSGLLIAAIVFGTVAVVELPDNSGLASLVLGTRYRPAGVFAGTAAAFAMHAVLAVAGQPGRAVQAWPGNRGRRLPPAHLAPSSPGPHPFLRKLR